MEVDPYFEFCRSLPKVELHAHLNGSISEGTIEKLLRKRGDSDCRQKDRFIVHNGMNYKEAFKVFREIHSLVTDTEALRIVTEDVIEEFREDNVKYLELRTTPKAIPCTSITKQNYLQTVLEVIKEKSTNVRNDDTKENKNDNRPNHLTCKQKPIIVRLLVSIDRGRSIEDARETLALVIDHINTNAGTKEIIGLDFSGNPLSDGLAEFLPLLKEAKERGIYIAVHVGEVLNEKENLDMLKLIPDRVGHAVFIHPRAGGTEEMVNIIKSKPIPVEICLTSNVFCGIVEKLESHHFQYWFENGHPVILCTDDKGIFCTSVSKEYYKAGKTFHLSKSELAKLSRQAIEYIAEGEEVKAFLRKTWDRDLEKLKIVC